MRLHMLHYSLYLTGRILRARARSTRETYGDSQIKHSIQFRLCQQNAIAPPRIDARGCSSSPTTPTCHPPAKLPSKSAHVTGARERCSIVELVSTLAGKNRGAILSTGPVYTYLHARRIPVILESLVAESGPKWARSYS